MAKSLDARNVLKYLANDSLSDLCLVCLTPLKENDFESIFTLICKEDTEYCVAEALKAVCQFQFDGIENYNICLNCFESASSAYKFHLQAKHSMEMIAHFTKELLNNVQNVDVTNDIKKKIVYIPNINFVPETHLFDFSLDGILNKDFDKNNDDKESHETGCIEESEIVVVKDEKELVQEEADEVSHPINSESDEEMVMIINERKTRKKRDPLAFISCSRCPIKYRFVSKLKEHMKTTHNVYIYYCKICKIISENKEEYQKHLKTHSNKHQCMICNIVYKKAETLVTHMKLHEGENDSQQSENGNMCELCGALLEDENSLLYHMKSKHMKKFTCYYCGRTYKGGTSFDKHIQKHEAYWERKNGAKSVQTSSKQVDKRSICQICGKDFVDERSLLWHQRLHNNDRPYTCEECGRGFVTLNRRNQHSICAHTPPSRRCPLCPALFHLRSMVNTHIKKVHLNAHKRRNRATKHKNVFWRTEPVPIQELSVDLQNDILELQATQADEAVNEPIFENFSFFT